VKLLRFVAKGAGATEFQFTQALDMNECKRMIREAVVEAEAFKRRLAAIHTSVATMRRSSSPASVARESAAKRWSSMNLTNAAG
jgi:hypothetical protein